MERENKVASGKKFECEERKKERKNWELGGGAAWTGGQLRFRHSEGKMEFWAEKRALPHYSEIRDDTRKIVTMSYELSLLTLH